MNGDRAGVSLAVDVGGTFTDLAWQDSSTGEVVLGKGPTTPTDVATGVSAVVQATLPESRLVGTDYFLHATTVGLNALLERKGATVGLLTTAGFRDVLEIRRGDREAAFDVLWRPSEPLVPRWRRLAVRERVRADGAVIAPLQPDDVRLAHAALVEAAVDSVAIVFLNAHANPEHELEARELLREAGYDGEIALSHEISGEYREFERTATTVVDAYVRPAVAGYLGRLDRRLREDGFRGESYASRSGGGVMAFDEVAARPVETILSGPAAGVVGAAKLARRLQFEIAVTADVGGTSFDTALLLDGEPPLLHEGRVGDLPLQTSWVDVRSIGAGGGSLARVEGGRFLRVGPESAGAAPGPACYGRGGTRPTVTDAAASLGMLADGRLAGDMRLDLAVAERVMVQMGSELGLSAERAAAGVLWIAVASMANAIRTVTVQKGIDPRGGHLIAYGGAGPLLAVLLARELAIDSVVIPCHAGAFSAWGLLAQDLTRTASRTHVVRLDESGLETANAVLAGLFARMENEHGDGMRRQCALDCRYEGQEYTLTVAIPGHNGRIDDAPPAVRSLFATEYERVFGYELPDDVEVVSMRATLIRPLAGAAGPAPADTAAWDPERVSAYSFATEETADFEVVDREAIAPGSRLPGPLIVREQTATTYVDFGFELKRAAEGELLLRKVA